MSDRRSSIRSTSFDASETSQLLPKKKVNFENVSDGIDLSDKSNRSSLSTTPNQESINLDLSDQYDLDDNILTDDIDDAPLPAATPSKLFHVIIILILASLLATELVLDIMPKRIRNMKAPPLILISLDGTRPEYLQRGITPNLQKLASNGIYHDMVPSFPSVTFPNHYTLVTGVYPETHGIVGNTFFDPVLNDTFSYSSPIQNGESKWWAAAEPIWISARKQGLITATCFWPGSEAEHDGLRPNYWRKFQYVSVEQELTWISEWIEQPYDIAPDLITLYIPHIDATGHQYGTDSSHLNDSLIEVDSKIGNLIQFLQEKEIYEKTNIVVVSDHGMTNSDSYGKVIFLDAYCDTSLFNIVINGPLLSLFPYRDSDVDVIASKLKKAAKNHGHFQVWKHDEIPRKFHYNNHRIGKILLLADLHWMFEVTKSGYDPSAPHFPKGVHGYDIHTTDMRAILIGHGPYFSMNKNNQSYDSLAHSMGQEISNVEVYPLIASILNIKPLPHNGSGILISHKV